MSTSDGATAPREAAEPAVCDLVIEGGWILDPYVDDPAATDPRSVVILGRHIVDVGPTMTIRQRWQPRRRIDASGAVVSPGFVDAHVHLGAFLGAMTAYERPTGPSPFGGAGDPQAALRMVAGFCSMSVSDDLMTALLRPALAAMLRSGFTGVVDAGGPGQEGAWQAALDLGIRAAVGPSLADRWHDEVGVFASRADTDRLLADAETFLASHTGTSSTVAPLISAVETFGCSDALLTGIATLAENYDSPVHVHSHISRADHDWSVAVYGTGPTARLDVCGLLTPRTTIMHAGALSDSDVSAFATSGITVNHNPVGNGLYGFGVAAGRSLPRLAHAGVPIVLGSDWTPAVTSPFELVRSALMLHRDAAANDLALSLEDTLQMATNGGIALGRPGSLGRLSPGNLADIAVISLSGSHHLASNHPIPATALHARPSDVTAVIVDGQIVVEEGALLTADENLLVEEARAALRP